MFDHLHPQAVHYLVAPSLRAISDVAGLTLEQKNARAAEVWAVMSGVDPYDAYSLMLYGQAFVLNDLCGDAARDALVEARSGMMEGTESPMKWRAMSAYASLARTFCQNTNTFLKVRKEMAPPPARSGGPRGKPKQPATGPAANAPPDAEGGDATDRDPAAASAHHAAAGRAADERSDSGIVTQNEQNTTPDVARHTREAPGEGRVLAAMPTEAAARASLPPVTVPPAAPLAADTMPPAPVVASEAKQSPNAGDTPSATNPRHSLRLNSSQNDPPPISTHPFAPPPPAVARSRLAGTVPRVRDSPRMNFSRRRSS